MTEAFFTTGSARDVFIAHRSADSRADLETALASLAIRNGLIYPDAHQAARDILDVFSLSRTVIDGIEHDAAGLLDQVLGCIDHHPDSSLLLSQLYTSVAAAQLPAAVFRKPAALYNRKLKELYGQCRAKVLDDEQAARDEIRKGILHLRLSPEAMHQLSQRISQLAPDDERSMLRCGNLLREHLSISAVSAMHLYLARRTELSPGAAAIAVCTLKAASQFHDAVHDGCETAQYVSDAFIGWFICWAALAAAALLCQLVCAETIPLLLSCAGLLLSVGAAPLLARKPVSLIIGRTKVTLASTADQTVQVKEKLLIGPAVPEPVRSRQTEDNEDAPSLHIRCYADGDDGGIAPLC